MVDGGGDLPVKPARWALAGALGLLAYLLAWPVPIDPVAWEAPAAPAAEGTWAPNRRLAQVVRYELGPGDHGPEDLHPLGEWLVGGVASGWLVRWPVEGGPAERWVHTGGRPLGLHPGPDGSLYVADAVRGLLRVSASGEVQVLCDEDGEGRPIRFADDVDVGPDGSVWFSDASTRFGYRDWKLDLLESRPNGRLLVWHPQGPHCEVVWPDLHFANGVAVAGDGRFVLVNETSRYRVQRLWLTGDRAGEREVWVDGLPGFPDGISRGEDGLFWIALASPRNAVVDRLSGRPLARRILARLPTWIQPAPARHPYVVGVDEAGQVVATLQDPEGERFGITTSVQQDGAWLYLGSLEEAAAARVRWSGP